MYKVFIKNTPLHIIEKKDIIPNDVLVIYEEHLELIQDPLLHLIESSDNEFSIYLVSNSIEETFIKLFKGYEFIEAAGGIVKRKNSYLFIKRNGFWDIPKGKLEIDESPESGAIREIEEECGIKSPRIENPIGITYHTYLYKGKPTIKKTYWFSLSFNGSKKLKGQKEEGISKVKWIKELKIEKIRKNTFLSILDVIDNYFKS